MLSPYSCTGTKLVVSSAIQPVMIRARLAPCRSTDASLRLSHGPVKPQYSAGPCGGDGKMRARGEQRERRNALHASERFKRSPSLCRGDSESKLRLMRHLPTYFALAALAPVVLGAQTPADSRSRQRKDLHGRHSAPYRVSAWRFAPVAFSSSAPMPRRGRSRTHPRR